MQYEQTELQPIETCTQAWNGRSRCCGQRRGEGAVVEAEAAARDADAAGAEPVAEVRDRAGAERDVDVGVELEDPLALRLGVAAADGDHAVGVLALARRRVAEVRGELRVGLLADRAGVEDDDVGLVGGRRLAEPELLEHALDPLGVVGVHLAAERGDVVAAHGPGRVAMRSRVSGAARLAALRAPELAAGAASDRPCRRVAVVVLGFGLAASWDRTRPTVRERDGLVPVRVRDRGGSIGCDGDLVERQRPTARRGPERRHGLSGLAATRRSANADRGVAADLRGPDVGQAAVGLEARHGRREGDVLGDGAVRVARVRHEKPLVGEALRIRVPEAQELRAG